MASAFCTLELVMAHFDYIQGCKAASWGCILHIGFRTRQGGRLLSLLTYVRKVESIHDAFLRAIFENASFFLDQCSSLTKHIPSFFTLSILLSSICVCSISNYVCFSRLFPKQPRLDHTPGGHPSCFPPMRCTCK